MNNAELAKTFTARGWKIFPVNDDKTPRCKSWLKDATTDQNTIDKWNLTKFGVPAALNGFFAVDIDYPEGVITWQEWIKENGQTGAGPVQKTPKGGMHVLFNLPEGVKVPNNVSKLGRGIDLRSSGYIATGEGYTWFDNGHGPTAPLTDAPAWLLDKIKALSEPKDSFTANNSQDLGPADPNEAAEYWLDKAIKRARPGNRNETGFWLACQLRDSGLSQGQARQIMDTYRVNVPKVNDDPYTSHEANLSLTEAYRGQPRKAATLPGVIRKVNMAENNLEKTKISIMDPQAPPPEVVEYVQGYELSDIGNGKRLASLYGDKIRWVCDADSWYIWP